MPALPTALLLAAAAAAPGGPPARLTRALADSPAGAERAAAATAPLVGRRYVASPLGEGAGVDPDPRFRLDAFDCVTFVETAIALGNADDLDEARLALDDVRYDGPPDFARRNHYVIPQWIPSALARGWVEEISGEIAGDAAVDAEERFDDARWERLARAGVAIRGLPPSAWPRGTFRARMVPWSLVAGAAARIPNGTIAWVVRDDDPDRPTRVTHAGLVVVGPGGERRVRHATSTVGTTRVIEEPIARFLRREALAHPRWRPSGLVLLRIRDNRARLAALRAVGMK